MRHQKSLLLFAGMVALALITTLFIPVNPPIIQNTLAIDGLNTVRVAEPMWGSQALGIVFVDTQVFDSKALRQRMARLGMTVAVADVRAFFGSFAIDSEQCLSHESIKAFLSMVLKQLPMPANQSLIVAGIGGGALVPFVNALAVSEIHTTNLSIDFSVNLPADLNLCPPLLSEHKESVQTLTSSPQLEDNWRAVWTDQPADATGIFIRALGKVDTRIAPYDTPLDEVLIQEMATILGKNNPDIPRLPVVEVPVAKTNDTLTLFYSGDGGWRDLDRTVAGEMAQQDFPVVGVDALRYFWEHKTPEQAAADLSATMAFYRQHWGVKSFVLAGYSFGADILPPIYNRLPPADQDSVPLLVLLALANHADFEIHVSGWLGQEGGELALAPELAKVPKEKLLCIYGVEEKNETACTSLINTKATLLELPGGHHFDQDYPRLTDKILDVYKQHGIL